jgi:hypothetical protein
METERETMNWVLGFVHKRMISAVKSVEFLSDRNVTHNTERSSVSYYCSQCSCPLKDIFYEELEHTVNKFPRYHMKILLGDLNAKVGREYIFKPTMWNENLHEISNDNGVRVVNFATSKTFYVIRTIFPHCNIHKYTWTSPDGNNHNQTDHILKDR